MFVLAVAALAIVLFLFLLFCFGVWWNIQKDAASPYTGHPLRRGSDVHWMTAEKVLRYLFAMHSYNNRIFDLHKAAFCRDTGRLFPNCVNWYNKLSLDWTFIEKRYPGYYVSWGSLSDEQKRVVYSRHPSLKGFQTEYSSKLAAPRAVEPEFAYAKPGPLYVDLDTFVLVGWKCVPDTELEVLVVQKPAKPYLGSFKLPEDEEEES